MEGTPARRRRPRGLAALAVSAAIRTGSSAASSKKAAANPFAHYGNITLNVWSADNQDPGAGAGHQGARSLVLEEVPERQRQDQVLRLHRLHQDHQARAEQRQRAGRGRGQPGLPASTPLLVKAKLILPLDKYAAKYGWDKQFPPGTSQQFRWTPDGKTFGKGNLWGVGQFGQSIGVFYNKALLKKYGGNPDNLPEDVRRLRASCWPSCAPTCPRTSRSSSSATRTATSRCTPSAWCRARTSQGSSCATGSSTSRAARRARRPTSRR